jgi:hypothetical protein
MKCLLYSLSLVRKGMTGKCHGVSRGRVLIDVVSNLVCLANPRGKSFTVSVVLVFESCFINTPVGPSFYSHSRVPLMLVTIAKWESLEK